MRQAVVTRAKSQHLVAIAPEQITAPQPAAALILGLAVGAVGEVRDYLGPLHLGLLAVLHDLGRLPAPKRLRSSRDITALQHTLADLETLGLVTSDAEAGFVSLKPDAASSLTDALDAYWSQRAQAALSGFERSPGRPRKAPPGGPQAWAWLRHMLAFISHKGLRVTGTGALHRSDLRRFEAICDLPPRQLLDDFLALGLGLDLFFSLDERLIIGHDIDLLDLPPDELAREILHRWVSGRIHLGLDPISSMGGLLDATVEPLGGAHTGLPGSDNDLFRHAEDTSALVRALLGPMPIEPISPFMAWTNWDGVDMESARSTLLMTHRRLRAGVLTLLAHLPRDTPLSIKAIGELIHAHIALDHLRRPTWIQNSDGHHTPFATATRFFTAFEERIGEHLAPWMEALLVPTGLARIKGESVWLTSALPMPPIPPVAYAPDVLPEDGVYQPPELRTARQPPPPQPSAGQGRLIVQPNGEVIAPPDASIHAIVHLACGAQPVSIQQVSTFTLTRRSLMRLSDAGIDVSTWADMLGRFSISGTLPSTVHQLVKDVARAHGEFTLAPAGGVLIARDPIRLNELMSYPKLARQIIMRPAPTVAILSAECDLQLLLFELGDRGFSGIFVNEPPKDG